MAKREHESGFELTPSAAVSAAEDGYFVHPDNGILATPDQPPEQPLITMQVVDIATLKYEIMDHFSSGRTLPEGTYLVNEDIRLPRTDLPLVGYHLYRFILSDGKNMISAKVYREATIVESRICKDTQRLAHDLVKTGRLRKGSVIQFEPRSHPPSGRGIVTIFRHLDVLGQTRILGAGFLEPCHSGVAAFSPSDRHHCTESIDEPPHWEADPLPRPVLRLARAIEDECGFCVVAGGAPLAKYLHDLPGCRHCYATRYSPAIARLCEKNTCGDVDLFIPLSPDKLQNFYGERMEEQGPRGYEYSYLDLPRVLETLFEKYGLHHTDIESEKIKLSAVEAGGQDYGWMRVFVGLKEKQEFHLVYSDVGGSAIRRPVQILRMDTLPASKDEPWERTVTKSFDADIVKCIAKIDNEAKAVKEIEFHDGAMDGSGSCLLSGSFNYIMRPCHTFPRMLERLNKYKNRGFELASFAFDDRVSEEWREHILLHFQRGYAYGWINEWAAATGVELPPHVAQDHCMSFLLDGCSEVERRRRNRLMLRDMVRQEVIRTDGCDPGGEPMSLLALKRAWKKHDEELQEQEEAQT